MPTLPEDPVMSFRALVMLVALGLGLIAFVASTAQAYSPERPEGIPEWESDLRLQKARYPDTSPCFRSETGSEQLDFQRTAGNTIYFRRDSQIIDARGQKALVRQARWLKDHPSTVAIIVAFCDDMASTREFALAVCERRGQTVRNMLVSHGVPAERLETLSCGREASTRYPTRKGGTLPRGQASTWVKQASDR